MRSRFVPTKTRIALLLCIVVASAIGGKHSIQGSQAQNAIDVRLLSVSPNGDPGDSHSGGLGHWGESTTPYVDISDDGRFVVYDSQAENLVVGDSNDRVDIFLYDANIDNTMLISEPASGGNMPAMSDDASIVAFRGAASSGVYVVDRTSAQTISIASASVSVSSLDVSGDGRYIAVQTTSPLSAGDSNSAEDAYVYDRLTTHWRLASVSPSGARVDRDCGVFSAAPGFVSISYSGRFIAFNSCATSLDSRASRGTSEVYVADMESGDLQLVSDDTSTHSSMPRISANGRYIVYTDRWLGDGAVVVHDRQTASTERLDFSMQLYYESSHVSPVVDISEDGRYVFFTTKTQLDGDVGVQEDVYRFDRADERYEVVSLGDSGQWGNAHSRTPAATDDGTTIAFISGASNLSSPPTANQYRNIFIRQMASNPIPPSIPAGCMSYDNYYVDVPNNVRAGQPFTIKVSGNATHDCPPRGFEYQVNGDHLTLNALDGQCGIRECQPPGSRWSLSYDIADLPAGRYTVDFELGCMSQRNICAISILDVAQNTPSSVGVDAFLLNHPDGITVPEGSQIDYCFQLTSPAYVELFWYNPNAGGWSSEPIWNNYVPDTVQKCAPSGILQGEGIRRVRADARTAENGSLLGRDETYFYVGQDSPPPCEDMAVGGAIPTAAVEPGAIFALVFRPENTGSCTWSRADDYHFRNLSGRLSAVARQELTRDVAPGQTAEFTILMTAPSDPGVYRTVWKLSRGSTQFGPQLAGEVTVQEPCRDGAASNNTPRVSIKPNEAFKLDFSVTNTGTCPWTRGGNYYLQNVAEPLGAPVKYELPQDISPGETTTFSLPMQAPLTPKEYTTEWVLKHGERSIGPRLVGSVTVVNCPLLSGTVREAGGTVVPLAHVIVDSNGERQQVETDSQGRFTVTGLRGGTYRLRVLKKGYKYLITEVRLPAGECTVHDPIVESELLLLEWPLRTKQGRISTYFDHQSPTIYEGCVSCNGTYPDVRRINDDGTTIIPFWIDRPLSITAPDPFDRGFYLDMSGHNGIDVKGVGDNPIYAPATGNPTVRFQPGKGYGNYVDIDHRNGCFTRFAHLDSVMVVTGKEVKTGESIGIVGQSGQQGSKHLHMEVRCNGVPVDPFGWSPQSPDPWRQWGAPESRWWFKDSAVAGVSRDRVVTHAQFATQLRSPDSEIEIHIPPGAFGNSPALMTLQRFPDDVIVGNQTNSMDTLASFVVTAESDGGQEYVQAHEKLLFNVKVDINLVAEVETHTLQLYRWIEDDNRWEVVVTDRSDSLTLSAITEGLGWYRVMAQRRSRVYLPILPHGATPPTESPEPTITPNPTSTTVPSLTPTASITAAPTELPVIETATPTPTATHTVVPSPTNAISTATEAAPSQEIIAPENLSRLAPILQIPGMRRAESVAFSHDADTIAVAGTDGVLIIDDVSHFDPQIGFSIHNWSPHNATTHHVMFNASDTLVVTGGVDSGGGRIRAWDWMTGDVQWSHTVAQNGWGVVPAISDDGRWLVSTVGDTLQQWRLSSTGPIAHADLGAGGGRPAISPDNWLAVWTADGLRLIHLDTGQSRIISAPTSQGHQTHPAFSHDGSLVAGGTDNRVRIWAVSDGALVQTLTFTDDTSVTNWVTFAPNNRLIAAGASNGTATLWDVDTGNRLRTLKVAEKGIVAIEFSPHGRTLVAGGSDVATLWAIR